MKNNIQTWKRLGLIFSTLNLEWSRTHSMLPTPFKLSAHNYRIFFGTRNKKNIKNGKLHIRIFTILYIKN